jgi:ribonuclease HI
VKTLKFDHDQAKLIIDGSKTSTWRLYDDKDLSVDDEVKIIDKVDSANADSWKVIGQGTVDLVIEKKLGSVTPEDMSGHEPFASQEEMLNVYRGYYGQRVNLDTPVKMVHFKFTPNIDGDLPTGGMLLEEAKIYTDGGSRGNPGSSACAYVICKLDDTVVEKSGSYLGMATNNQAEYFGFLKGLERARELGIDNITLFSDSQLVVSQMNGEYKVKNQELLPIYQDTKAVANSFEKITFTHIPRELNKTADLEVNRILDENERHKKHHHHG